AAAQIDGRLGAAHHEAGNGDVADAVGGGRVDRRDFRLDLEAYHAVLEHGRGEVEADAVLLVLDGDLVLVARHGNRELATGEEAGALAGTGDQVRLGQLARDAAILQRLDGEVYGEPARGIAGDDVADGGGCGGARPGVERDAA